MVAVIDANSHRSTTVYDAASRVTCRIDALGKRTTFTFDNAGQPATRTDPRGQVTTFTFDDAGQQTGIVYADATRVTFTFDDAGQRTGIADASGTQTVTFDDAGRVTAVAQPGGKTLTYTYDNASRREAMVDPDGGRTTYSFEPSAWLRPSRLTSLLNPFSERTTWAYDAAGRATTITLANGTRTTMGYDDASQVTLIRHSKSDDTQVAKYEYSYNDAGVRTSVLEGNSDRVTWSYDNAWRLAREQRSGDNAYDITYSYDSVGSRATKLTGGVTTTYSYNAGDAVTGADAGGTLTTYSWDDAGNNTVLNANGTLTTYTWDGENRLKTIQTAAGTVTLTYSVRTLPVGDGVQTWPPGPRIAGGLGEGVAFLRRSRQDASATRKYVWDFQNLLVETDGDGTTVAQYTGGLDAYGPIVSQRRSSTSRFYHPSVLGTVETLTAADASVTDTYIIDAWGAQRAATGSTTNPFRYIGALGYYTEPDLDLAYVRARWLRPGTGSWLSVDPLTIEPRFAYVRGRVTGAADPLGLQGGQPHQGGGGPNDLVLTLCTLLLNILINPTSTVSDYLWGLIQAQCDRLPFPLNDVCKAACGARLLDFLKEYLIPLLCTASTTWHLFDDVIDEDCTKYGDDEDARQECCNRKCAPLMGPGGYQTREYLWCVTRCMRTM